MPLTLPDHDVFRKTKYFGSLDGLRAISIIGVIWSHVWYTAGPNYFAKLKMLPVLRSGDFGVDAFFCISGFLITTILLREQSANGRISLRDFYIRRALRIWPLYYGMLALYIVLVILFQRHTGRAPVFFAYLPSYLTFTYTWARGWVGSNAIFNFSWSLSTEEQFYALWAPVIRLFRGVVPVLVMCGAIALRLTVFFVEPHFGLSQDSLVGRIFASIAIPICLGGILAYALDSPRCFNYLRVVLGFRWAAPAYLLVLIALLAPVGKLGTLGPWFTIPLVVGACVIREDNGLRPILAFRPAAYIGLVSYGMYMFNTLVLGVLNAPMSKAGILHPLLRFAIALVTTVLVAGISYKYFESPFLRLKRRGQQKDKSLAVTDDEHRRAVEGNGVEGPATLPLPEEASD